MREKLFKALANERRSNKKWANESLASEDGSISVEAVIILPVIFTIFMSTFTYFDVFRAKSLSLKANYAISDFLSRDDDNVTMNDMKGAYKLFRYLSHSSSKGWIRVTMVECKRFCNHEDQTKRKLKRIWSQPYPAGSMPRLTTKKVRSDYNTLFPKMYPGEYLLMVETSTDYVTPFAGEWTGIFTRNLNDLVVTKPRGGPKICFENVDCNSPDD